LATGAFTTLIIQFWGMTPMADLKSALDLLSQIYQKPAVAVVATVADKDINTLGATISEKQSGCDGCAAPAATIATSPQNWLRGRWLRDNALDNNNLEEAATAATAQPPKNGQTFGETPVPTLQDFERAFAKFCNIRSRDLRHDQRVWCAEIFLRDWGQLAAGFGWTPDDLFAPVRGAQLGIGLVAGGERD
jgi:hypothetical protein